jgi:hypothetical protein
MPLPTPTDDQLLHILQTLPVDDQLALMTAMLRAGYRNLIDECWVQRWITANATLVTRVGFNDAVSTLSKEHEAAVEARLVARKAQREADLQTILDTVDALRNVEEYSLALALEAYLTNRSGLSSRG